LLSDGVLLSDALVQASVALFRGDPTATMAISTDSGIDYTGF